MVSHLTCVARKAAKVLLCAFPWGAAQALIDVSPKVVEMKDKQTVVRIINNGATPEFVNITLYQVTNPGVPPKEEQMIPVGLITEPYLYATPFKLSLGPRQEKQVQLTAMKIPEKEKVYRLAVIPQHQTGISDTHDNVMLVSLGFKGLIRQLPSKIIATWQHRCEATRIQLEATGTVRVEFSELKVNGSTVDDVNVYPGTPYWIEALSLSGKVEGKPFQLLCHS
ncbi:MULTISPECIES: molecular chaperone [unclassified Serratia (in: enterobacteria)]|uniref:fimbrial biogenesis chaperone n=1 Tax=unclassified Serratia (in: enterobacteria) TaxID=2647522 RepID=UPI001267BCA0|nr:MULTISPECIES: hypothetical protein [unclassified Serratia (in: enterobacteria)]